MIKTFTVSHGTTCKAEYQYIQIGINRKNRNGHREEFNNSGSISEWKMFGIAFTIKDIPIKKRRYIYIAVYTTSNFI